MEDLLLWRVEEAAGFAVEEIFEDTPLEGFLFPILEKDGKQFASVYCSLRDGQRKHD